MICRVTSMSEKEMSGEAGMLEMARDIYAAQAAGIAVKVKIAHDGRIIVDIEGHGKVHYVTGVNVIDQMITGR